MATAPYAINFAGPEAVQPSAFEDAMAVLAGGVKGYASRKEAKAGRDAEMMKALITSGGAEVSPKWLKDRYGEDSGMTPISFEQQTEAKKEIASAAFTAQMQALTGIQGFSSTPGATVGGGGDPRINKLFSSDEGRMQLRNELQAYVEQQDPGKWSYWQSLTDSRVGLEKLRKELGSDMASGMMGEVEFQDVVKRLNASKAPSKPGIRDWR